MIEADFCDFSPPQKSSTEPLVQKRECVSDNQIENIQIDQKMPELMNQFKCFNDLFIVCSEKFDDPKRMLN